MMIAQREKYAFFEMDRSVQEIRELREICTVLSDMCGRIEEEGANFFSNLRKKEKERKSKTIEYKC